MSSTVLHQEELSSKTFPNQAIGKRYRQSNHFPSNLDEKQNEATTKRKQ